MTDVIDHVSLDGTVKYFQDTDGKQGIATIESTSTASKAYAVGDYLWYNGKLYIVTSAIASSGTITVGTNVSEVTVGGQLGSLTSRIATKTDLGITTKTLSDFTLYDNRVNASTGATSGGSTFKHIEVDVSDYDTITFYPCATGNSAAWGYAFMDANNAFVSGSGILSAMDGVKTTIDVPSTAKTWLYGANGSYLSADTYKTYIFKTFTNTYAGLVNTIENSGEVTIESASFNVGAYVDTTGALVSGANWAYTDYVSAERVNSISSKAYQYPNVVALVAFYDINKTFLSAVSTYDGQSGTGEKSGTINVSQIPTGAAFMRFSSYKSYADKFVKIVYDTYPIVLDTAVRALNNAHDIAQLQDYSNLYRICGYPFSMAFVGDSLTYGQTYVAASGTYAYKNKSNYPEVFKRIMNLDTSTVIGDPGASAKSMWTDNSTAISNISDQFVIVWLGTNGGLTDTVDSDCSGSDITAYADTNTGYYGRIIQTLLNNGNKVFLAYVCYTSVLPVTNTAIDSLAERFGCNTLALTSDEIGELNADKYHTAYNGYVNSVHFNSIGYNRVANMFYAKMMSAINDSPADFELFIEDA